MLTEKSINKYFNLAKNASELSDFPKIKIGAILIYKNKVVSVGYNCQKTSPLMAEYNKYRKFEYNPKGVKHSFHAEILCLHKAENLNIDFSKTSLFVYRQKQNGNSGMSKPCCACREFINNLNIKDIYYTTNDGWIYEKIK
jgi:deoxycytidylate deaminase